MAKRIDDIILEGVPIIFKNFSGQATKFNAEGNRNFCVIIDDDELVERLTKDGWNIKVLKARDPDEKDTRYLPVSVSFNHIPPKVMLMCGSNQTRLDESTVGTLDYAEINRNEKGQQIADVIVRPYNWEVNGKFGIKAYLKALYVQMEADPFEEKYSKMFNEEEDDENLPF